MNYRVLQTDGNQMPLKRRYFFDKIDFLSVTGLTKNRLPK